MASLALCFSGLILTANADPQFLGNRTMLALVIVFAHAWILAVTERACPARGVTSSAPGLPTPALRCRCR